ncbi:MAG: precorrin-8X methylmutase [Chloroflexi bacterium]|nr:precorrin-8X methylmutase [Chloroflexota bacterium]MCL5109350.1 precorrin-8X methylmutase [Chloroflexota bacterium]
MRSHPDDSRPVRCALRPAGIETRSFAIIAGLLSSFDQSRPEWPLIRRIAHSTGDPAIADHVRVHAQAVAAGIQALRAGRPILTDVKMVAAGINLRLTATLGCEVVCAIDDPAVAELARRHGTTRSAASINHLAYRLPAAIVAIGNAPTALFALLDYLDAGNAPPALVVGTPVGFVGAAEAKAALVGKAYAQVPYITVEGTRGGSAIAAAAVNALLRLAVARQDET